MKCEDIAIRHEPNHGSPLHRFLPAMKSILTGDLSDIPTQTKGLTLMAEITTGSQQQGNNMADDTDERKKTQWDKRRKIRREKGRESGGRKM